MISTIEKKSLQKTKMNLPEELASSSMFLSSLFLLICTLLLLVHKLITTKSRTKLNLPPSPPKLPLIGNLHQVTSLPHRSFQALSAKYGDLMLLQLGKYPTLVVSSAEIVKEIVRKHDIAFSNRPKCTGLDILIYGGNDVALSPYGKFWSVMKKTCMIELLNRKKEISSFFVKEEEVALMINKLRNLCVSGETVNLSDMATAVTNTIISRCVMSQKVYEENGGSKLRDLFTNVVNLIFKNVCFGDIYPHLRWLDFVTGYIQKLKASSKELNEFFDRVIMERMKMGGFNNNGDKEDFLDTLLRLQQGGMLNIDLTQDNIKAILLDMIIGGTDTTTSVIEWAMTELIKNPKIMGKVQEEVRGVVGKKTKIEENDIRQMDYLNCVVKETLRLHPPTPLLLPRETRESVKLGGFDVPSKTKVYINAWAIQRDPRLWDKPDEFEPDRFRINSVDVTNDNNFQFIPFGFGRRVCPGMSFGLGMVEYVIASLLCWFDWKLPNGVAEENLDTDEINGLTITRKVPLLIIPMSPNQIV